MAIIYSVFCPVENEDCLLTISQDGYIMKYTIAQGPHLIGSRRMQISLVEEKTLHLHANR